MQAILERLRMKVLIIQIALFILLLQMISINGFKTPTHSLGRGIDSLENH